MLLGILLLNINKELINKLNQSFIIILKDNFSHNHLTYFSMLFDDWGISVYINNKNDPESIDRLRVHSKVEKYTKKVQKWFGIIITKSMRRFQFFSLNFPWEKDQEFEKLIQNIPQNPFDIR